MKGAEKNLFVCQKFVLRMWNFLATQPLLATLSWEFVVHTNTTNVLHTNSTKVQGAHTNSTEVVHT